MAQRLVIAFGMVAFFLAGAIGLAVGVPLAYYTRAAQQRYEQDVEDVTAIAAALGYSDGTHIDVHRVYGVLVYDLIDVVFYSTDTFEGFLEKVNALGLEQKHFYLTSSDVEGYFLELTVNSGSPEHLVTLNGLYTREHFKNGGGPQVSQWNLRDQKGRLLSVYYAQPSNPQQVWMYGSQPLPGNVVVVTLNRTAGVTFPSDDTGWALTGYILLAWVGVWGVLGLIIFSLRWAKRKMKVVSLDRQSGK